MSSNTCLIVSKNVNNRFDVTNFMETEIQGKENSFCNLWQFPTIRSTYCMFVHEYLFTCIYYNLDYQQIDWTLFYANILLIRIYKLFRITGSFYDILSWKLKNA